MQLRGTDAIHEVNCIEVLIWCSELSGDGSAVCAKRNRGVREARDTAMASGYARIVIKARVADPRRARADGEQSSTGTRFAKRARAVRESFVPIPLYPYTLIPLYPIP